MLCCTKDIPVSKPNAENPLIKTGTSEPNSFPKLISSDFLRLHCLKEMYFLY